jgi:hypothetical protein
MKWPTPTPDTIASPAGGLETHHMDVYLEGDRAVDVRVDGESVYPTWFKLEFKESGEVSAKVKGLKLSSRRGDVIHVHVR